MNWATASKLAQQVWDIVRPHVAELEREHVSRDLFAIFKRDAIERSKMSKAKAKKSRDKAKAK